MGNSEQPTRELGGIVEFGQILIRLQKNVLAQIRRVFSVPDQPQQIVENTLLPSGHEEVVGLHISPPGFGDEVAIFNFAKDQLLAPFIKTPRGKKKSKWSVYISFLS
jgi:hypothetical protein